MRGLSTSERAELVVLCGPHDQEIGGETHGLIQRGCAAQTDEDDHYWYYEATELGRLALRVCPIE